MQSAWNTNGRSYYDAAAAYPLYSGFDFNPQLSYLGGGGGTQNSLSAGGGQSPSQYSQSPLSQYPNYLTPASTVKAESEVSWEAGGLWYWKTLQASPEGLVSAVASAEAAVSFDPNRLATGDPFKDMTAYAMYTNPLTSYTLDMNLSAQLQNPHVSS